MIKDKRFTSDRWANRMGCRFFSGADLVKLQDEMNDWFIGQEYVKVLNSKAFGVGKLVVIILFYIKIPVREYNER